MQKQMIIPFVIFNIQIHYGVPQRYMDFFNFLCVFDIVSYVKGKFVSFNKKQNLIFAGKRSSDIFSFMFGPCIQLSIRHNWP